MNYPKRFSIGKMYQREKGIYQKDENCTSFLEDQQTQYQKDYIKQGLKLKDVELATFYLKNGLPYRGLKATQDIPINCLLVQVPRQLIISSQTAFESSQRAFYFKHREFFLDHEDGEEHAIIAFLIMNKRDGNRSKYYRFIKQLPKDVNMLIFWPENKLSLLQDENLIHKVHKKREEYEQTYLVFKTIMDVTEEEFQWAYSNLYTRDFGHNLKYKSMVPFCEFFNHECVDVHIALISESEKTGSERKYQQNKRKQGRKKQKQEGFYNEEELQSVQSSSDSDNSLDLDQDESDLDKFIVDQIVEWASKYELQELTYEILREYILHKIIKYSENSRINNKNVTQKIMNWKEDEDFDYFCISSQKTENFKKGAQVYFNYGRLSNRELLLRYGIALEKNKYDHIYLRINAQDVLKSQVNRIFQKQVPFQFNQVLQSNKRVLFKIGCRSENQDYLDPQSVFRITNVQTELKGLTKAIELLQQFKAEFKEDLANSDILLQDKTLGYDEYFALVYRLEKQRILQHNIILLQLAREILLDPGRLEYSSSLYESSQYEYTYRIILKKYLDQILKK